MSKNQKVEEEEWEDVDELEEDEEEEDTTIANSDVVVKYKRAAAWANEALKSVIDACKEGAVVDELCALGDSLITEKVASMFKGLDKGIAFPTCISVNNCVCHNAVVPAEAAPGTTPQKLAAGDVVHIDLGVHIDGYAAFVAHTVMVTADDEVPEGKAGNVIQAAYTAIQTAVRKMRPGVNLYEITDVIEKVAAHFGVSCVEGVLSHQLKRHICDNWHCISCKRSPEHMVHDYTIEPLQVWTLDIAMTTGKGKLKEKDTRTTVFKQTIDQQYQPKMDSARDLLREIDERYGLFPFSVRNFETKKVRLGLNEMIRHGVVAPYPVLYEKEGESVGHFKITLMITPKKIERITGLPMQKAKKEAAPFTDEALIEVSKLPFSLEEKKKKEKKAE